MKCDTITMQRGTAEAKLREYARAVEVNPSLQTAIDQNIVRAYKKLARGARLIDVNTAIAAGGLDDAGRPRIAIARADAPWLRFGISDGLPHFWWHPEANFQSRYAGARFRWRVPWSAFAPEAAAKLGNMRNINQAVVPHIPLPLRPAADLANYYLLWEAKWRELPTDPYLLRPVAGSLMEILAEWDLTPLEASVVAAAAR